MTITSRREEVARAMMNMSRRCFAGVIGERPSMIEVMVMLKGAE